MSTDRRELSAAAALQHKGDLAGAEAKIRAILDIAPDNADALFLLGQCRLRAGWAREAAALIDQALAGQRRAKRKINPEWLGTLGAARMATGDAAGAAEAFTDLVSAEPGSTRARLARADALLRAGNRNEAIADLREVLRLEPHHPVAAINLGAVLIQTGRVDEALAVLGAAVDGQSGNADLLLNYAMALRDAGRPRESIAMLQRALAIQPDMEVAGRLLLPQLLASGRIDEAEQAVESALGRRPDDAVMLTMRGAVRLARGDREPACAALREALDIDPGLADAHMYLAEAGGDREDPRRLEQINAALGAGELHPQSACQLHFTAGKRCLFLERDRDAMAHFEKANAIKRDILARAKRAYDPPREERAVEQLIAAFGPASFAGPGGSTSQAPVFVVGMPRSGTSLIEQILATHPAVFGAGELGDMAALANRLSRGSGYPAQPPAAETLREEADAYLRRLRDLGGRKDRYVDKMPLNFRHLGLIARLFPNARIIHARRDPMDTCLSCFFQNFSGHGHAFAYDLDSLAHAYRLYMRLMDHWRRVLPAPMLEIDYEALVENQRMETERLIRFLDLDWNDACLTFHETGRPVMTASQVQVRQPIYRSSIGTWRRFADQLSSLAAALADIIGPAAAGTAERAAPTTKLQENEATTMTHGQAIESAPVSFADVIHPVAESEFFEEFYDRKHLHVPGGEAKFSTVMSWDVLSDLLNMTAIWSSSSLQLVLDREVVPPRRYCHEAKNRDGGAVLQPDSERVMDLLRNGASLVANDIDTLTPELAGVASALENALNGKAQANLYCSWRERQAFASHFDTHDVYALHIAGEKVWRLYETRIDNPIAHPRFKTLGQEWHEQHKGAVAHEILMRPGDLLYIPRGLYHDALATSDGTIHIAFGVTYVTGMDALDMLWDMAVGEPAFRRNMPRSTEDSDTVAEWLADLGHRLADFTQDREAVQAIRRHQAQFRYARGGIRLPVAPSSKQFRLNARDLTVEQRDGKWRLSGGKGSVPIPEGMEEPVSWIVSRSAFSEAELRDAFPSLVDPARRELIDALRGMKVIVAG